MTMVERLYEVGSILPPAAQAELLDFAEFLRQKNRAATPLVNLPLQALAGGLSIQRTLRHLPWPFKKVCAVNGIDYLLDTNFILGLLKSAPETLALIGQRQIEARQCAYSAITRMELLGFPGLAQEEEALIKHKLAQLAYQPITPAIENEAIRLRRTHTIKLPDAIIAASASTLGAELLTHDQKLQAVMTLEIQRQVG